MEPPAPIDIAAGVQAHSEWLRRRRRRRSRWRFGALAAFLALGLSLGTIWASGFATTTGAPGEATKAAPLFADPGNQQDTSGLNGLITSSGNLTWSWTGQWGRVASQSMYTANLNTLSTNNHYYVGVYLTNVPTGFSSLQLQMRIAELAAGKTCAEEGITKLEGTDPTNYRVMVFDAADAQVTFSGMGGLTGGLPGGKTYCVGIIDYSGSGQDSAGTFIRKSSSGPTFSGIYPTFIAALNQMK